MLNYLGDAVRYFTPQPTNINERQKIRQAGISLLRKLHEKDARGKQKYDRVVVVGHSLGSVIGYDLLNIFWNEKNLQIPEINNLLTADKTHLDFAEEEAVRFSELTEKSHDDVTKFRASQFELWKSQYYKPNAWLVSDFITLGSPLGFTDFYLADNKKDFLKKIKERQLPTCPPEMETPSPSMISKLKDKTRLKWFSYPTIDNKTNRTLHHGAVFSMTRWTNFFFHNDYVEDL